jgi:C-terminal processing protease CtpA/Prc
LTKIGPVPTPGMAVRGPRAAAGEDEPDYMKTLNEMRNWKFQEEGARLRTWTPSEENGESHWYLGSGGKTPVFSGGFPSSFVQRLGRLTSDFHYSGTYTSGDLKIGYLRVPSFSPSNLAATVQELEREIDYFEKNTDGLVVDVMRNNGGGCYMLDLAAHLIPYPFYFFGEEIRVTRSQLQSMKSAIDTARRANADQWIIDVYQSYLEHLEKAYAENRGRTGTIPACTQLGQAGPPLLDNQPAKIVYTKPLIVLIDEFSVSAADIFPAMMQDNARGPLVGMRSSGGGGSVSSWPVGIYSESTASCTNSLVVRKGPVSSPEYPTAAYVENIGAIPDIELRYMTRENLLNRGQPFVEAFTKIIADRIKDKK